MVPPGILLLIGVCYMLWPHSFACLQPECDSIALLRLTILTVISHLDSYIVRAFSFDFRIEWRTSGNGAGRINT